MIARERCLTASDTRFWEAMGDLRQALATVKQYSAEFSDRDAQALLMQLYTAGPNEDGDQY